MKRIPSKKVLDVIKEITSKNFDRDALFQRLVSGDSVFWGDGIFEIDSSLMQNIMYLFVNGVCKNTCYEIKRESLDQAIADGISILLDQEQNGKNKFFRLELNR